MRRRPSEPFDVVEAILWLALVIATIVMAVVVIRPVWDMTAWVG